MSYSNILVEIIPKANNVSKVLISTDVRIFWGILSNKNLSRTDQ